jgi:phage tail P2-like protein
MNKTIDIAPSSITSDPQVQAACEAVDDELRAIYECMASVPGGILFWPFTDEQVQPMIDIIAWELHVDVWQGWDGDLSDEQKKDLINKSIDWHRHLGTKRVVEDMLRTVFKQGYIQEWWSYGGRPFYFRIVLNEPIVDPERLNRVIAGIIAVKNVRSWWEDIALPSKGSGAQMYVTIIVGQRIKNTYIPVSTNPNPNPSP